MKSPPPRSGTDGEPDRRDSARDFKSFLADPAPGPDADSDALGAGMATERGPGKPGIATDFQSVRDSVEVQRRRLQGRGFSDWLVSFLTPLMIFIMVNAFVFFLLDIRYVYTEVQSINLRVVAFLFVLGIVSINRLAARDGKEESFLYIALFTGAMGLYTLAMTSEYGGVGSVARNFMNRPFLAAGFNMGIVALLWWVTNRLTHECCVDENPSAGDEGILTGTARRFQRALQKKPVPRVPIFRRRGKEPVIPMTEYIPVDPSEWRKPEKKRAPRLEGPTRRLPKRHPGVSIFYFSVPVMFAFAVGMRVVQHGGEAMVRAGHFYVGCYTVSALMLLMLSSLGGLREYFRARRIAIPGGIGPFWMGLGTLMVLAVLVGATRLPLPGLPDLAYIGHHQTDYWTRYSTFRPVAVVATPVEMLEQSRFVDRVGAVVLVALGAFVGYGLLKALGVLAAAVGRRRHRFPPFVTRFFNTLERFLERITRLPSLPTVRRRPRISREVATSAKYRNPLGDPARSSGMTTADLIENAYEALCAFALDLGVPRRDDQTPYEFIDSFPEPLGNLREEAIELTELYVRSAYSRESFDERVCDRLRKFWLAFDRVRGKVVR